MQMIWTNGKISLLRDDSRPSVMGVLNVTPDSFSDGGRSFQQNQALKHAEEMVSQGVDILDIGGESSRPGAAPVSAAEEWSRIGPVIREIRIRHPNTMISVDTYKPETASKALLEGVHIINDIRGLSPSERMGEVIAQSQCGIVIMHMQGMPETMQKSPKYDDVISEVIAFFRDRIAYAESLGISRERISLDPGIGFGKTLAHNLQLLANLPKLSELGCAVLIGTSRKRMIGEITGRDVKDRMAGSLSSALFAAEYGASILRVHDVAETVDALKVWSSLRNAHLQG